ncbi:GNAT family N-acetyltransferase [Methylomonas methanica]|uniref:GCN5-related N-acetyltransferase n=1 Tax=Methylomonas methanica (strain DSM 25384 / MC09) TaxID=857087 RepID=G0A4J4_METMM|nr:GNAT family N-acetyltransferase [Methylomonas methanica]AEG01585.1 GCN5-related N-acetyltransferase [Methylomonas methanica MC09]
MELEWVYSLENTDWQELSELYRVAPLGDKKPDDLQTSFSNSRYICFVFDAGKLVAAGRALADGVDCSYICDVAVLPDYQGLGIGKAIVGKLIEFSKGHRKIILYASAGNEAFYRRLDFRRMSTAMAIFADQEQALAMGLLQQD